MRRALSVMSLALAASMLAGCRDGAGGPAAEVEWGPEKDGIATRLAPLEDEHVLGRPMRFRLEMVNRTPSRMLYDVGKIFDNPSIVVTGPDGGHPPHIKPSHLTNTYYASMGPGEVVVLLRSFDIASQHHIDKPGRYGVHYEGTDLPVGKQPEGSRVVRGRLRFSDPNGRRKLRGLLERRGFPSNTVEIQVLPGELPPWQVAAGRLLGVLPEGRWKLSGVSAVQPKERGLPVQTRIRLCTQGDRPIGVTTVWETERRLDSEALGREFHGAKNEYWGRNERGHVYVWIPPAAEYVWADARAKIADALGVADTAPATPERIVNIRKLREALLSRDPKLVAAVVESHPEIIDADLGSTRKVPRWTRGHALAWATRIGDPALAEVLLDSGANIEARTRGGGTSLFCATRPELGEVLRLLLARGADVNAKSRSGWTPLHVAALGGHAEAVKTLLDSGANINQKTEAYDKYTPLHVAARGGHLEAVEVLLAHGADVSAKGRDGRTPLDLAEERGREEVAELLVVHGGEWGNEQHDR